MSHTHLGRGSGFKSRNYNDDYAVVSELKDDAKTSQHSSTKQNLSQLDNSDMNIIIMTDREHREGKNKSVKRRYKIEGLPIKDFNKVVEASTVQKDERQVAFSSIGKSIKKSSPDDQSDVDPSGQQTIEEPSLVMQRIEKPDSINPKLNTMQPNSPELIDREEKVQSSSIKLNLFNKTTGPFLVNRYLKLTVKNKQKSNQLKYRGKSRPKTKDESRVYYKDEIPMEVSFDPKNHESSIGMDHESDIQGILQTG